MRAVSAYEQQTDHAWAVNYAHNTLLLFDSSDLALTTAISGTFTLAPRPAMQDAITKDNTARSGMVFGEVAELEAVLAIAERFEQIVNSAAVID
ncbi:MAG: hypothetical protein U1D69_14665 [Polynucleobacter sp.]|nr:hypothetical protein [Polynucleobacter sp.]